MKKVQEFDVIMDGIADTSAAPRGRDIFYRCGRCADVVPSDPRDNVGCSCGNVFIDVDYFRLAIEDYKLVQVLRKRRESKRDGDGR